MKKRLGLLIALLVVPAGIAVAGVKSSFPVSLDIVNRTASGSIGSARASADSNQYIGCQVNASTTNALNVLCSVRDTVPNFRTCQSFNATLIQAATAITANARLYFAWDAAGNCTSLSVTTNSQYLPATP